jgi:galactokinase
MHDQMQATGKPRLASPDEDRQSPVRVIAQRACDAFFARFQRPPTHVAAAPGRVNLIGEHTDYNDGLAMPMAIDRWTVIAAARSIDHSTLVSTTLGAEAGMVFASEFAPAPGSFESHVYGVAAGFAARGIPVPQIDGVISSSIPMGSGLASSAAMEVAAAKIFSAMTGASFNETELAHICRDAEHRFVGTPCGLMDMLAVLHARRDHALRIDCRSSQVRSIPLPPCSELCILVVNTMIQHRLAAGEYAKRRSMCETACSLLKVRSLRDIEQPTVPRSSLSQLLHDVVTHVLAENVRVDHCAEALNAGDLRRVGQLLIQGHESLRRLYRVSCDELDFIIDHAADLHFQGIYGARMTGGGFGGCAIVLLRPDVAHAYRRELSAQFDKRFGIRPDIFAISAVDGAAVMEPGA